MDPQDSSMASSSGSSSSYSAKPLDPIDTLLAGAGYTVRSSELNQVAQRLQNLENAIVNNPTEICQQLENDVVHYNPANLASWVDSLLSELNQPVPEVSTLTADFTCPVDPIGWVENHAISQQQQIVPQQLTTVVTAMDQEDSGIRLVHVLMTCAESIQLGDLSLATSLIHELRELLTRVNIEYGIGKVAGYFIDALSRRLFGPLEVGLTNSILENEIMYHHFYEASPCLKFAHFMANQAILEAFDSHDCVHVIDFNLMQGLQWPALIQALALRPGGPPSLRLTGIGPPSPDGHDSLREIGLKLAELARSVNVRFSFRGVGVERLDDIKQWMLQVSPKEVVAINSIMQLHKLLLGSGIDTVLGWIHRLNPKVVTIVEQEANHNKPEFLGRFTEALYYYSTMFDSLEASSTQPNKALAELYIHKEICNLICCEGSDRVERHEPLANWKARLNGAGFKQLHMGSNAFKQASMLLTLFSAEGYCVEENEGCLTMGWHNRPLIAASAWQAIIAPSSALMVPRTF